MIAEATFTNLIPLVMDPRPASETKIPEEEDNPFAPASFEEYVGQEKVKEIVGIIVDSAKINDTPLPNLLFFGSYGLGKTTLGKLVFRRLGVKAKFVEGSTMNKVWEPKGYYLVDEIHNINNQTADYLNTVIDTGKVHIIGCTTNPGGLPAPFRSRFRLIQLENYTPDDITTLVKNAARRKEYTISDNGAKEIAARSKLNPRVALNYLSFAHELSTVRKRKTMNVEIVKDSLEIQGVDEVGLTKSDRLYLSALSSNRATGLQQISAFIGLDTETISNEIEPYLLQQGLVKRTPKGRVRPSEEEDDLNDRLMSSIERLRVRERDKLLGDVEIVRGNT